MNSRERVSGCLRGTGYDRIPIQREGTPEVDRMLLPHFGLSNREQLLRVLGDDFRCVPADYVGPELKTYPDKSFEGFSGERCEVLRSEFVVCSGSAGDMDFTNPTARARGVEQVLLAIRSRAAGVGEVDLSKFY